MPRAFRCSKTLWVGACLLLCAAVVILWNGKGKRVQGNLTQGAYAWNRVWSEPVIQSLNDTSRYLGSYSVLVSEFSVQGDQFEIENVRVDFAPLVALEKPITLVVRIQNFPDSWFKEKTHFDRLRSHLLALSKQAKLVGLPLDGIQLDFDCATRHLGSYAAWLDQLSPHIESQLSITALPSWMSAKEFKTLIRAVDYFVLQVHSFEKPENINSPMTLCDPAKALAWIEKAGRFDVPFYVALPPEIM